MTPAPRPQKPSLLGPRTGWLALGLALIAVFSFYYWTAATSAGLPPYAKGIYSDYYSLLMHGFLKGHLSLDVATDPAMLAARNPYDPAVWIPHGWMADASYYRGKYYLYFGAAPALVFLLPYRLITGGDLWLGTAGSLAVALAFCALVGLWLRIRRDHFPRSGGAMAAGAILALGGAAGLLAAARRPYIYEFPIASGCLFTTLMLHSLYSSLGSRRKGAWMAAAGVCLGLAVASRPPLLFAILAPLWILARLRWGRSTGSYLESGQYCPDSRYDPVDRPSALGFALGFGAIFAGMLVYNYERFGNFLEFGFHYQLTDLPAAQRHMLSPSYFWFNLRLYYTAGIAWSRHFPFASIIAPGARPKGYYMSESVYGLLKYTPVIWFALACPLALRRKAAEPSPSKGDAASQPKVDTSNQPKVDTSNRPKVDAASPPRLEAVPQSGSASILSGLGPVIGMLALAYLGPGLFDLAFESSAIRYTIDFLPCLILVSAIGAMALEQALRSRPAKCLVRSAWLVAAIVSAGVAAIISIPLDASIVLHRGNAYYEQVARILNLPAFWYERARDWHYGPVTWRVALSPRPASTVEKLAEAPDASLLVEYLPGNAFRPGLKFADGGSVLWGDACRFTPGQTHALSATFGSLYPDTEHPYYFKHAYSALARSTIVVSWDHRLVLEGFRSLGPVDCEDIRLAGGEARPGWFSGRILGVKRNQFAVPDLTPEFAPRTLRMVVPDSRSAGRWPLVSAGAPGGGDLLFLETGSGPTARFGYYSTGSALRFGPRFPLAAGSTLECVVQMEQFAPSGRTPGPPRPLLLEMNGRIAWLDYVPYHPCAAGDVHVGENRVAPSLSPSAYPGGIALLATPPRLSPAAATGHLLLRVVFPTQPRYGLREPILITGTPGAADYVNVIHYYGGTGRFVLDHSGALNREGTVLGGLDSRDLHDIEVVTPVFRLYRGSRALVRGVVVVRMDGREVLRFESDLFPTPPADAAVGVNDIGEAGERRFLGAILSQRWVGGSETNVAQTEKLWRDER